MPEFSAAATPTPHTDVRRSPTRAEQRRTEQHRTELRGPERHRSEHVQLLLAVARDRAAPALAGRDRREDRLVGCRPAPAVRLPRAGPVRRGAGGRPGRHRRRPRRGLRARHPRPRHRPPAPLSRARRPSRRDAGPIDGQERGDRRRVGAAGQGRPRLRGGRRDAGSRDLRADPDPHPGRPRHRGRLRAPRASSSTRATRSRPSRPRGRRSTSPRRSPATSTSRTSRSAGRPAGSGSRMRVLDSARGSSTTTTSSSRSARTSAGINQIIEHWLVWQGDSETTCRLEDDWTLHNLDYLRRKAAAHRISA